MFCSDLIFLVSIGKPSFNDISVSALPVSIIKIIINTFDLISVAVNGILFSRLCQMGPLVTLSPLLAHINDGYDVEKTIGEVVRVRILVHTD